MASTSELIKLSNGQVELRRKADDDVCHLVLQLAAHVNHIKSREPRVIDDAYVSKFNKDDSPVIWDLIQQILEIPAAWGCERVIPTIDELYCELTAVVRAGGDLYGAAVVESVLSCLYKYIDQVYDYMHHDGRLLHEELNLPWERASTNPFLEPFRRTSSRLKFLHCTKPENKSGIEADGVIRGSSIDADVCTNLIGLRHACFKVTRTGEPCCPGDGLECVYDHSTQPGWQVGCAGAKSAYQGPNSGPLLLERQLGQGGADAGG